MIKRDNVIPSTWPGREDSIGDDITITGLQFKSTVGAIGQARSLGAVTYGSAAVTGITTASPTAIAADTLRLAINNSLPRLNLPPSAAYQVPGNANSTDYACGADSLNFVDVLNGATPIEIPIPTPVIEILGFYKANVTFAEQPDTTFSQQPIDTDAKCTQLLKGTDFYVNLKITPSVGLPGYIPTKFTVTVTINNILYTVSPTFDGWPAGSNASNYRGDFYRLPGSLIPVAGQAKFDFSAGQKGINAKFGTASIEIPVVEATTQVSPRIEQRGCWYKGIQDDVSFVSAKQSLQLAIDGPADKTFVYNTPWQSGSGKTDTNGKAVIPTKNVNAGNYNYTITFDDIPTSTHEVKVVPGSAGVTVNAKGPLLISSDGQPLVNTTTPNLVTKYNDTLGGVGDGGAGQTNTIPQATTAGNSGSSTAVTQISPPPSVNSWNRNMLSALGDSTTWGYNNGSRVAINMVQQAQSRLSTLLVSKITFNNYGVNSTTLGDAMSNGTVEQAMTDQSSIVAINFGMNEAYRSTPLAEFEENLRTVYKQFNNIGKKVILQAPNYTTAIANVEKYVEVVKSVALEYGLLFDNKWEFTKPLYPQFSPTDLVHPTEAIYIDLGNHLAEEINAYYYVTYSTQ